PWNFDAIRSSSLRLEARGFAAGKGCGVRGLESLLRRLPTEECDLDGVGIDSDEVEGDRPATPRPRAQRPRRRHDDLPFEHLGTLLVVVPAEHDFRARLDDA